MSYDEDKPTPVQALTAAIEAVVDAKVQERLDEHERMDEQEQELADAVEAEDAAIADVVAVVKKAEKVKKVKAPVVEGPTWLTCTQVVEANNLVWLTGYGKMPADIMIVGDRPNTEELNRKTPFCGDASQRLFEICTKLGIDLHGSAYCTYAVKYISAGKKAIGTGDIRLCRPMLLEEIRRVNPKIVICLGSKALAGVMGAGANFEACHGTVMNLEAEGIIGPRVVTTYHPASIFRNPAIQETFEKDLLDAQNIVTGKVVAEDITDFIVIKTCEELECFKEFILSQGGGMLSLDCEWHGVTWMEPTRYFRTIQLAYAADKAVVLEMTDVGGVQVMDDPARCWLILKSLLEHPSIGIVGHNVISDGEWLLSGDPRVRPYPDSPVIDIRKNVVFDTMLAEYLINEMGPFGLEAVTGKYTRMGRYDAAVAVWRKEHQKDPEHHKGFGMIPRDLLLPYGAKDVTATWRVMIAQQPLLTALENDVFKPRGHHGQYPSLWQTTMQTQAAIYELEMTGMLVDTQRLNEITVAYMDRLHSMEAMIVHMAQVAGFSNFNYRSGPQKIKLLFDTLGLQPVKTTKGKAWGTIRHHDELSQAMHTPAVDKTTLEILEHAHPLVKMLSNVNRVDTIVKNFLNEDDEADEASKGGGIKSKIWPDGRVHTHFSQLSDTGRFRHSKPNSANYPKKAESYMADIFGGKDKVPPGIRTIIVPPEGHVFMEGDFTQAELFVLAALSGDMNMWEALTTPGKDMHDTTAIASFNLSVLDASGNQVSSDQLVALATRDMAEFEKFQDGLTYVGSGGKTMTRKEFKNSFRVAAKQVSFGIAYGRGAADIARQIKADTGTPRPLPELEAEITTVLDTWKTKSYPVAWSFLEDCAAAVATQGYVQNPFGRRRRFPKNSFHDELAGMQREAMNFPVQSTVADACMIAMQLMLDYRAKNNLHFKLVNQVHDAIMLQVPIEEIDATKVMFKETMGNIDIPVNATRVLRLGVDIEVLTRWGEKQKAE